MLDELQARLDEYLKSWQDLVKKRDNQQYFAALQPTAVAWKFSDRAALMRAVDEVRDVCDQIHFGWVNNRWLVSMYLRDSELPGAVRVIKFMERRPGSTDNIGLDHVDFYASEQNILEHVQAESGLNWNEEINGDHCKWISVWFDMGEAQLRTDTVLKVCADEMLEYEQTILGAK